MLNREIVIGVAGLLVGGLAGSLVTYKAVKKRLEDQFENEVERLKAHYDVQARRAKTGPYASLEEMTRQYRAAQIDSYFSKLRDLGYTNEEEATASGFSKEEFLNQQLGEEINPEWAAENQEKLSTAIAQQDQEGDEEIMNDSEAPYLISLDEYQSEHDEYDKLTLTYYEGDDTVADSRDEPIDDVSYLIGDDALTSFGRKGQSKTSVYVRNDSIGADIEVNIDPGKYSVAVLGEEPEKPKVRKMRVTD